MKREYKLIVTTNEDGILNISSTNDGYTAIELLGLLALKQDDIMKQLKGEIEPDTIKKTVIKD